ncbi:hypothetical protein TNCV_3393761 [Trichonephila clavipes]|nr:hypothetical protein TNCV_3393761 [Trichonephila clavipes]
MQLYELDGHGSLSNGHGHHELVTGAIKSRVRVLMLLKTHRVKWLMHVKPVVDVVWKEWGGAPRLSFSSLDTLQWHINEHSLTLTTVA